MASNIVPKIPKYLDANHPTLGTYRLPSVSSQQSFDEAINYKFEDDDIIVVSYPKNGTTWTLHAINLWTGGKTSDDLMRKFPFIEMFGPRNSYKEGDTRIFKTHMYFELTPQNPKAKYIYVARNPKDCVVSFYYHTKGFSLYDYADGKFDDYFELFINGEVDSGDYFKMVGEWYMKSKTNENILFILYEDMKKDFKKELLKMAKFLGPKFEDKLLADNNKLLEEIIHESKFANMQANEKNFKVYQQRPKEIPFIRKGIIGDWKNMLSEEQSKRIDKRMEEAGKTYPGFDKLWGDILKF